MEEDLERPLPREWLMEVVCVCRMSQGGLSQAADDGRSEDEISGGKMHLRLPTSPARRG